MRSKIKDTINNGSIGPAIYWSGPKLFQMPPIDRPLVLVSNDNKRLIMTI